MSHADVDNEKNLVDFHPQLFDSLNLNDITIEDIEEVIEKDKVGGESSSDVTIGSEAGERRGKGGSGKGAATSRAVADMETTSKKVLMAETKILIQPAQKALRFRYECEGRSAGSIPGANSIPENKTYPTIQVLNHNGPYVVVVSCVTKDPPFRPHPHKLVGKDGCKRGICTVTVNNGNMICSFPNLGIQCVKRKDIDEALRERAKADVDPFRTAHSHRNQSGNIDLNSVRLCFQVFLKSDGGMFHRPLPPVVSDPIYDKKSMCDLVICKLSACSASVWGGAEIILLCEKIVRDDIQVRFYELKDGQIVWEGFGDFQPSDVHKQVAISLKTPKYRDTDIQHPVEAHVQLRRPSDGTMSDPRSFQFLPADSDPEALKRKRQKIANASLELYVAENTGVARGDLKPGRSGAGRNVVSEPRLVRQPHRPKVKTEPRDSGYTPPTYLLQPTTAPRIPLPHPPVFGGLSRELPDYYASVAAGAIPKSVYNPVFQSISTPSSQTFGMYGITQMSHVAMAPSSTPEVITVPSHSSSGSSNPAFSGVHSAADLDQHHQGMSSGSTHLSLGLGSLGSLPLSESTLSIIGSHLSDTFMCLNSDSIEAQLNPGPSVVDHQMDFSSEATGSSVLCGGTVDESQQQGREPSMDSLSGLLNQLTQLNERAAVGGMDLTSQTSLH